MNLEFAEFDKKKVITVIEIYLKIEWNAPQLQKLHVFISDKAYLAPK